MKNTQIVILNSLAPSKPNFGAPCNGCGVCCAAEPCPIAFVFLGQFRGRCRALLWLETESRYTCGLVTKPEQLVEFIPTKLSPYFRLWFAKRISAGSGCDSKVTVEVEKQEF